MIIATAPLQMGYIVLVAVVTIAVMAAQSIKEHGVTMDVGVHHLVTSALILPIMSVVIVGVVALIAVVRSSMIIPNQA